MITDLHALVPDGLGVTIVSVADLVARLNDGEEPEEAITNAGVDSFSRSSSADELAQQVERVRQLNLTGDTTAFWHSDG